MWAPGPLAFWQRLKNWDYVKSELDSLPLNKSPHTSVPAGVYLFPNPLQRFALRIWPGTIQVSRSR